MKKKIDIQFDEEELQFLRDFLIPNSFFVVSALTD